MFSECEAKFWAMSTLEFKNNKGYSQSSHSFLGDTNTKIINMYLIPTIEVSIVQIIQNGDLEKASFGRERLSKALKGMWEFIKWGKPWIPQQEMLKCFKSF